MQRFDEYKNGQNIFLLNTILFNFHTINKSYKTHSIVVCEYKIQKVHSNN